MFHRRKRRENQAHASRPGFRATNHYIKWHRLPQISSLEVGYDAFFIQDAVREKGDNLRKVIEESLRCSKDSLDGAIIITYCWANVIRRGGNRRKAQGMFWEDLRLELHVQTQQTIILQNLEPMVKNQEFIFKNCAVGRKDPIQLLKCGINPRYAVLSIHRLKGVRAELAGQVCVN